jgi:hypothetical protein
MRSMLTVQDVDLTLKVRLRLGWLNAGMKHYVSRCYRRYRVTYSLDPPDRNGNYSVEHSSAVFIFDQIGHPRLLAQRHRQSTDRRPAPTAERRLTDSLTVTA